MKWNGLSAEGNALSDEHRRHLRGTGEVVIIRLWNLLMVAGCMQSTEESNELDH